MGIEKTTRYTLTSLRRSFSSLVSWPARPQQKYTINKALTLLLGLSLAGCGGGSQSVLEPAGAQAYRIEDLWWLFFGVTGIVYLIVMAVVLIALLRSRREQKRASSDTQPDLAPDQQSEKRIGNVIKASVGLTIVILFLFMVSSFRAGREITSLYRAENPLVIKIVGRQWWWEVEYRHDVPSQNVTTANEIHIPVGRPVRLELESTDVIHSFWVPNLHGKKDLVPGYKTSFIFQADEPGTYWGQCAEFCGHQHAKMRFVVVAESEADFNNWYTAQQQPSVPPSTDLEKRGQEIFLVTTCTQCHTVQGTPANGRVGPNLTHIASRPYIAAGSLRNTEETLAGWILNPHASKPGVRMPMNTYSNEDQQALVAYLKSLK